MMDSVIPTGYDAEFRPERGDFEIGNRQAET